MKYVWVFFLAWSSSLLGVSPAEQGQLARALSQAGAFSQAKETYEVLLKENLPLWQRDAVAFNLAHLSLIQGNMTEATVAFERLLKTPSLSPPLQTRIWMSLAYAFYKDARAQQKDPALDAQRKGIFLLRQAKAAWVHAKQASCEAQKFLGGVGCPSQQNLKSLEIAIERAMGQQLVSLWEARIAAVTPKIGVPFLLRSLKSIERNLMFLQEKALSKEQRNQYGDLYLKEAKSWLPLWVALEEKLSSKTDLLVVYLSAHINVQNGWSALKNRNWEQAMTAVQAAEIKLLRLMRLVWGEDPLTELLYRLLTDYQAALLQDPIQLATLDSLEKEQENLLEVYSDLKREIPRGLLDAEENLLHAIQEIQKGEEKGARFFIEEAASQLRLVARVDVEENTPEQVLEWAIEDQEHALSLARLASQMETPSTPVKTILKHAQKQVIESAERFTPTAFNAQKSAFDKYICQKKPWDQVFPIYEMGVHTAQVAKESLPKEIFGALPKQEETLHSWRQALDWLRNPPEEPPPPKPEPEKAAPIEQVFRELQLMEQQDRGEKQEVLIPYQGERPW